VCAAALVAYCNAPLGHPLPGGLQEWPKLRAANGHPEPYRVKYVQIGNETWMFDKEVRKKFPRDPEAHWHKCLKAYIRAILEVDPSVKLIIDAFPEEVSAQIHEEFGDSIAAYTSHHYLPWEIKTVEQTGRKIDPSKLTAEEIWKAWVSVPAFDSNGQALLEDEHLAQARKLGTKIAVSEWNWNGWWDIGKTKPALDSLYAKGLGAASMLVQQMRSPTFSVWPSVQAAFSVSSFSSSPSRFATAWPTRFHPGNVVRCQVAFHSISPGSPEQTMKTLRSSPLQAGMTLWSVLFQMSL
jgi:hypothetical protein